MPIMSGAKIRTIAVIGAGAAGAAAAAALAAEKAFEVIRVFERRHTPGGTWIYDPDPTAASFSIEPGKIPPQIDPPLKIPENLPQLTTPSSQNRYDKTPIYENLTTNVPDIAMSFSDRKFAYGPFVPHWVPKQYIEEYFSFHRTDALLVMNTTVENVARTPAVNLNIPNKWRLTLRRHDSVKRLDVWWEEEFDAVIIANGHYSVPFVPAVKGLNEYMSHFPGQVSHSKSYRSADLYANKRVLIVGNSASGHDITTLLVKSGQPMYPVYQSRRSASRWDGTDPPPGVEWKPVIQEYRSATKEIVFEDQTRLAGIDAVIYCTGYKPSFPFWDDNANGGPLYDYTENRLRNSYQHTFFRDFPRNLGIVGQPRVLTFRSFEYQAIALARLFSGRNVKPLPSVAEQEMWERDRAQRVKRLKLKFHDIQWDNGETMEWLRFLFSMSGLPALEGLGRCPPVLGEKTRWALENIRKYPEPDATDDRRRVRDDERDWVIVETMFHTKDGLYFI